MRFKLIFSVFSQSQLLQQKLETSFYSGHFSWDDVNPNDAAALLKKFIRELPAPLLTSEYVNTFSAVRGGWASFHGITSNIRLNSSRVEGFLQPRAD